MKKQNKTIIAILAALLIAIGGYAGTNEINISQSAHTVSPASGSHRVNVISPQRRTHILYGDERGGGHFHGVGKPCKSEFPANWSEERVIEEVSKIAANDNLGWRQEDNGYYVAEQQVDTLKIRVVLDREKDDIVTGYPVNVERNPCPDNDNRR